jgi:hypothetical protein
MRLPFEERGDLNTRSLSQENQRIIMYASATMRFHVVDDESVESDVTPLRSLWNIHAKIFA